jgi:hypothetical protein
MPIAGVEVDVMKGNNIQTSTLTNASGEFDLRIEGAKPPSIDLRFRKSGYGWDRNPFSTDIPQPINEDLAKLP